MLALSRSPGPAIPNDLDLNEYSILPRRYLHLQAAARTNVEVLPALRQFVNLLLEGSVPRVPELLDYTLLAAFDKLVGVRPITLQKSGTAPRRRQRSQRVYYGNVALLFPSTSHEPDSRVSFPLAALLSISTSHSVSYACTTHYDHLYGVVHLYA